ncbi:MAG: hypothetical protein RIT28_869 [Pseudomonadota bacterium]
MSRPLGLSLLLLGACAPAAGPTADAGFNVHGAPGQIFAFDGSTSAGESLRFQWTVLEAPADANFTLEDADSSAAMLIPETEGTYVLGLEVCNSYGACDRAETEAWVGETATRSGLAGTRALGFSVKKPGRLGNNRPPEAVAMASKSFRSSSTVRLNGSGSSDPDGDTLRYRWSFYAVPADSTTAIDDSTSEITSFTADKSGTYKVKLTVRDGLSSDSVLLPEIVVKALDDDDPIPWITSP